MTRTTVRSRFWLFAMALVALAQPVHAQVPANSVPVKTYTGYYNDTAVYFTAFETNDFAFAAANNLVFAPRLSQVNSAALPQMIFFLNAGFPQSVVLSTEPGQPDYSPLWQVVTAQWVDSSPMPLITSLAAAQQWAQQGKLALQNNGIIFNGPVILINRSLNLQDTGTLAPTISPSDFLGINPSIRTAYIRAQQGYYAGQVVTFLGLEHAPGQIQFAPGAIPVPTLSTSTLGSSGLANFYAVDNQIPVIDSIPAPLQQTVVAPGTGAVSYGTAGPGYSTTAANYSPIWHVSHVSFNAGVTPQPLTSVQAIQQAASAGQVTITPGRDIDTFNCPVPFYYQFGTGTTPTATPTYIPPGSSAGTTTGATTGVTTGATTGVTTTGTTTAGSTTSGMTTGATTTGGTTGGTTTGSTTSTTGFPY